MIKFIYNYIVQIVAKLRSDFKKQNGKLCHLKLEVTNWTNPPDETLPPDIELEIFYMIEPIVIDEGVFGPVNIKKEIQEIKIFSGEHRTPLDFGSCPLYIQQEIIEEIWHDHRRRIQKKTNVENNQSTT